MERRGGGGDEGGGVGERAQHTAWYRWAPRGHVSAGLRVTRPGERRLGQIHLPEQRLEPRVRAQRREQERSLDPIHTSPPLLIRTLQTHDRRVVLPQPRVHV